MSWASSDAKIWVSSVTRLHGAHPGLSLAAGMIDVDVKSKTSGELERACITIKCKPIPATLTQDSSSWRKSHFVDGSLDIHPDHIELLSTGIVNDWQNNLDIHMDRLYIRGSQRIFVIVIKSVFIATTQSQTSQLARDLNSLRNWNVN